ncbi:hypothetical protein OG21DRAFT_1573385 [Imleria badia]|nr:hypothetical protein OG21DRAFT_1573385 [Imleria badia]
MQAQLSITLPYYSLSFFVNERKELESCDFKHMVYNEDQTIGALFGLENLLVLRPKSYIAGTLVPEAFIPSCHRPDPLTGKTGAQSALFLLQSAESCSIMKLKALDDSNCQWSLVTLYPQINTAYLEHQQITFCYGALPSTAK